MEDGEKIKQLEAKIHDGEEERLMSFRQKDKNSRELLNVHDKLTIQEEKKRNKAKGYYGLMREPDVAPLPQENDDEWEDKPKKSKNDPDTHCYQNAEMKDKSVYFLQLFMLF